MDALSLWGRYGGRAGTSGGQATSGYARGVWVSVPPYGITLSETVLLVDETHVDLRTVGNGGQVTSAVGADIRFEEESTSVEMPREILHYDGISGRVVAAVAIGTLAATTPRHLRMLYGSSGAVADDSSVWAGFLAAWSGADGLNRADDPSLDLAPTGLAAGTLYPWGATFDSGDHASHADGSFLNGLTEIEICAQIKSAAAGVDARIIAQGPHTGAQGDHGVLVTYDSSGFQGGGSNVITAVLATTAGVVRIESASGVQTTDIQHVAIRWASGSQIQMEINGEVTDPTWAGTIVNGVATRNAIATGTLLMPAGTFELGGLATDPWVGEIGIVTIRQTVAGSVRGQLDGRNRFEPRRAYGVSDVAVLPVSNPPVVAMPMSASQSTDETVDYDVAISSYNPDGAPVSLHSAGSSLLAGSALSAVEGMLQYTSGATLGQDKIPFTLTDGFWESTANLYLEVEGSGGSGGGGTVTSGDELPTPLRTVNVSNRSQLDDALSSALPGDDIILANGNYGSTPINPTQSGTALNPVVIRAANRTGAWIPGVSFPAGSHDIHVHDIDLRNTSGTDLRGKRNWLIRCWLKPRVFTRSDGKKEGTICVRVHTGTATTFADACRIAYCNLELQTDAEVGGGDQWWENEQHKLHCVRGTHAPGKEPWHKYLVIERIRLIAGPTRNSYRAPNGEHIETVETESSSYEPIHWHITHFYGDNLPTRETIFDEKASYVTVCNGTCYGTSGKARIQNRQGRGAHYYNINGALHLDVYAGSQADPVRVHDCNVTSPHKVRVFNGVQPWDDKGGNGAKQSNGAIIGNIGGNSRVEVGQQFSSAYVHKAINTRVEGSLPSGGYVELNGATATRNPSPTNFTPKPNFLIDPDEVGINAPWVGLTTPGGS